MIGGYCEDGYPLYFANYEMVKLMGYESYGELAEAIGGMVIHTIHPDDRKRVMEDIGSDYYPGLEYTTTYRMPRKDGSWFWVLDKGKVIRAEDGRLAIDVYKRQIWQIKIASCGFLCRSTSWKSPALFAGTRLPGYPLIVVPSSMETLTRAFG